MIRIVCKKDFNFNNEFYVAGKEIEIKDINIIKKLNELGYINPLSISDLIELEKQFNKEGNNDTREYRETKD